MSLNGNFYIFKNTYIMKLLRGWLTNYRPEKDYITSRIVKYKLIVGIRSVKNTNISN